MQRTEEARRAAHAGALEAIRSRVEAALCLTRSTMSPDEATALALQAGSEEPDDVKELFALQLDSTRARRGVERAREIGIRPEEVAALFGPGSLVAQGCAVHNSRVLHRLQPVVAADDFCAAERTIVRALSCTLAERNAKVAWALPSCRLCAYVALHADEDVYIELLGLLVGKIVLTDARRLDDLRSRIAEEGVDVILLNRCAMALGGAASAAM